MYVQPGLQLRNALQTQQFGIQRNAAGMAAVGEQLQSQMEATYAASSPTGVPAGFLNQGAFFNNFHGAGLGTAMAGAAPLSGATFGGAAGGAFGATSGAASRSSWAPPAANTSGRTGIGR